MNQMKIGIVGYGHVGKVMNELFTDAVIFDEPLGIGTKKEINQCDVAFVCVPTPQNKDGACDVSIVENVIRWIKCPLIILRSTVYVGFTDEISKKYNKEIVFQPEYYGETVAHPFANLRDRNWITLGGTEAGINMAINAYKQVINASVAIYQSSAKEAELAKYMENAFFAAKVIFCNEFYDIAKALGVNYNVARELWLADPRIGPYHTFVYENNRGYGGSCLPKDISAIVYQAKCSQIDTTFLDGVIKKNMILRNNTSKDE